MGHSFYPDIQMLILRLCDRLGRFASNCTTVLFWGRSFDPVSCATDWVGLRRTALRYCFGGEVLTQFLVQHCNSQKAIHAKVNTDHSKLLV